MNHSDARNAVKAAVKNTRKAPISKKHPQGAPKKHPQGRGEKHRDIIPRGDVWVGHCVCSVDAFERLLAAHKQGEWNTVTRRNGLLALQGFMLRSLKQGTVRISLDCSHDYVSAFKRAKSPNTIKEPLQVLCEIGICQRVQAAVNHHVKNSAAYALQPEFAGRQVTIEVLCPPGQARRFASAPERRERRLNKKHKWRAQLIRDQGKLTMAPHGVNEVLRLLTTTKEAATKRTLEAIANGNHPEPFPDVYGTIHGTLNGIPTELKPRLLIDGEPLCGCDISHAHACFLPVLLRDRIEHCADDETRADYIAACQKELLALIRFLSDGDFYAKWSDDPGDPRARERVKKQATQVLNMPTATAENIPLYQRMRATFPILFAVIEDIKRNEYRALSNQLQRITADLIEAALIRAQALGIPALPDTDALHVPARHRGMVCKIIGEEVSRATGGVCCKVGGIRYAPPRTNSQNPSALVAALPPIGAPSSWDPAGEKKEADLIHHG